MKIKITGLIFALLLLLGIGLIVSCEFGFESKRYYSRRRANIDTPVKKPLGKTPVSNEEAVQTLFDKAEAHKDEPFPASNFDDWVFYMTAMDGNAVGTFKFSDRGTWTDNGHYETYISGIDVGSGLKTAWNLCYYRYKNREARWQDSNGFEPFNAENDADGKFSKREERFLFFKFTGDATMNTKLNNSMICVDTYTKFVWNYSEPGILKNIAGNAVPTQWVDYEDPNLKSNPNHTQIFAKFYMYDPVGYVTADGDVVMYDWVKPLIQPGDYRPRQIHTAIAEHDPDKPGYSPYLPAGIGFINAKAKSIENVDISGQDTSWSPYTHPTNHGIFNYKLNVMSKTSAELDYKKEVKIDIASTHNLENVEEISVKNRAEDIVFNVELSKHDLHYIGLYQAAISKKINNCEISTSSAPIKLIYDGETEMFGNPTLEGVLPAGVTCSFVNPSFTLALNETKNFQIKYTVDRADIHCVGSVIVTYELNWVQ